MKIFEGILVLQMESWITPNRKECCFYLRLNSKKQSLYIKCTFHSLFKLYMCISLTVCIYLYLSIFGYLSVFMFLYVSICICRFQKYSSTNNWEWEKGENRNPKTKHRKVQSRNIFTLFPWLRAPIIWGHFVYLNETTRMRS